MQNKKKFIQAFLFALVVQLCAFAFYWFFANHWSEGRDKSQNVYLLFYYPVLYVFSFVQKNLGIDDWGAVLFLMFIAPLVGIVVYSTLFALGVSLIRRFR